MPIQVLKLNKSHNKKTFFLSLIISFAFGVCVPLYNYAASPPSLSLADYREKLGAAIEILQSEKDDQAVFASESIAKLREIFPAQQDILVDEQTIRVDNAAILDSFERIAQAKDAQPIVREAKKHIALLLEETKPTTKELPTGLKRVVSQILARKEFAEKTTPPFIEKVKKWIEDKMEKATVKIREAFGRVLDKVSSFLKRFVRFFPSVPDMEPMKDASFLMISIGLYAITGVLVIALVIVIIRKRWYLSVWDFFRGVKKHKEGVAQDDSAIPLQNWQKERQRAEDAMKNGDLKLAFHHFYLSLLLFLENKKMLLYHESTTNWEYIRQLKRHPEVCGVFRHLTKLFEYVWYGGKQSEVSDLDTFVRGYDQIITNTL